MNARASRLAWGLSGVIIYPAGLAALAFLLTPDGHFLSPRWRWAAWIGAVMTAVLVVLTMTDTGIGEAPVPNPTAVPAINDFIIGGLGDLAFLAGLGVLVVAGSSCVVRLLRAQGDGQTRDRVIVTSQLRTISLDRVRSAPLGVIGDRSVRRAVRQALAHHLGLDVPAVADGAR